MNEKPNNMVNVQFKSIPENVSLARVLIASIGAQLDLTISEIEELKVAVSEAVSNSIIHGYQNDPEKTIELDISTFDDRMIISVIDRGIGINDVNQALQPSFTTDNDRLGLGFAFIQSFMDKLEVKSEPNMGTSVTMVKNLAFSRES